MTDFATNPLVSTQWLADNLGRDDVRVVDGSFYLPAEQRNAAAEFEARHIPGAVFFDIDQVCDKTSSLPHMFPSAAEFAEAVGAMGIARDNTVVTYDGGKMTGACRVWWMFRAFGHADVAVLDGGVGKWMAEDRPLESGAAAPAPVAYEAWLAPEMLRDVDQMLALVDGGGAQILDARSAGRFDGSAPEPRAGLRSGHMPGAFNLPYDTLLTAEGTLRPADELRTLFAGAGIDLDGPVVTSCGSGVSAAVLLLALYRLGHRDNALYDGSWSEWGSRDDTPIVV